MADKWQMLEEELKLLKNEIKQVLIDIKERLENPMAPSTFQANVKKISLGPANSEAKAGGEAIKMEPAEPKVVPAGPKVEPVEYKENSGGNEKMNIEETPHNGNGNGNGHGKTAQEAFNSDHITIPAGNGKKPHDTPVAPPKMMISAEPVTTQAEVEPPQSTGKPTADLLTVAMLSRWLANGVRKVGRQRMEVLVDIYSQIGGFPVPLRDSLMKLLNTDDGDGQSLNEGVALLIEVDNLIHRSITDKSEAAILSLFLNNSSTKNNNGREVSHR